MGRPSKVPINRIDFDRSPHPRVEIHHGVVEDYAEHFQAGDRLPPVTLFLDGGRYLIGDGWHRITAAIRSSGQEADSLSDDVTINAIVQTGTLRDCILFAVGANGAHGLRPTTADRRKAVLMLLGDEEWSKWADREIATLCNVSPQTVNNFRRELKPSVQNGQMQARKVKRGGREYEMKTARIGKRAKKAPDVKGAVKADPPPPVQSEPAKEPGGDPRHEVREPFAEGMQSIINKLPGCPEEPSEHTGTKDSSLDVCLRGVPCPDYSETVGLSCIHIEDLLRKGFAYWLKGQATLRVRDENRNGSERELNYCPVCGEQVLQEGVTRQPEQGYGDVEAAASAPMTA